MDGRYRIHFGNFPSMDWSKVAKCARHLLSSIPSQLLIQSHNTYDTIFNGAINPNHTIAFSPGLQLTVRRDMDSPVQLNPRPLPSTYRNVPQPVLELAFVLGRTLHEFGAFHPEHQVRATIGASNFVVGRPWWC